ncbi:uncharacterized protein Z518_00430 [Rhinocladiella mackenziei CBS 650.93]|uniref:DUF1749-domain-containing protein n=1 Tax=Rhinocladiella mackenziei CBS 650.93 TaxID=1442369 RepID=A0A0D2J0X5_9EURO|nr:uncharacterized protein Z518_00430 [Rhinocladiella mackenziei CBS 650.93]KIX09351.1 hypothetical protein Z518_00430 [Rhinocladiella mackenziei CBS 650.93]
MDTIIHVYHPKRRLLLLEYTTHSSQTQSQPPNVLLFIGGLYDNFRSPRYIDDLAALFPRDGPAQKWRVMHVQMSSAGKQFGLCDLDRDVEEISAAITYIREHVTCSPATPVVLMGHSTGCQDVLHYLCSHPPAPRPIIAGGILQAPVSDREAIIHDVNRNPSTQSAWKSAMSIISSTPKDKYATTILPLHVSTPLVGPAPVNITRFLSLTSPDSPENPAMDDYFSSDLTDARLVDTFGRIGSAGRVQPSNPSKAAVLIIPSGSDEHVAQSIDKAHLLARWKEAIETPSSSSSGSHPQVQAYLSPHSQIIRNALHDISGASISACTARLIDMRAAVLRYLGDVVGDIDESRTGQGPWAVWERDRKAIETEAGVAGIKL